MFSQVFDIEITGPNSNSKTSIQITLANSERILLQEEAMPMKDANYMSRSVIWNRKCTRSKIEWNPNSNQSGLWLRSLMGMVSYLYTSYEILRLLPSTWNVQDISTPIYSTKMNHLWYNWLIEHGLTLPGLTVLINHLPLPFVYLLTQSLGWEWQEVSSPSFVSG